MRDHVRLTSVLARPLDGTGTPVVHLGERIYWDAALNRSDKRWHPHKRRAKEIRHGEVLDLDNSYAAQVRCDETAEVELVDYRIMCRDDWPWPYTSWANWVARGN